MVSCARATRGFRRPSLDTRNGRPSSTPSSEKIIRAESFDGRSGTSTGTMPGREKEASLEGALERAMLPRRSHVSREHLDFWHPFQYRGDPAPVGALNRAAVS